MPLTLRQPAPTCIGLDIGTTAVRAIQWRREHDCFALQSVSVRTLRPAFDDNKETDRPIAEIVRTCVRDGAFRRRNVCVALNTPAVAFHALELPAAVLDAPPHELQQLLQAEVQGLVDTSIDDWECRHWTLPPTAGPGPSVMAANAKREAVLQSLALCDAAGLSCRRVDAAATAIARFAGLLRRWPDDAVMGVLDIGHVEARLVLCIDDTPVLIRRVGHGGAEWTRRVADSLQLSMKSAELHIREHGIAPVATDDHPNPAGRVNPEIASIMLGALRPELRELAAEVKRSYEYVLSCYRDRSVSDLVLTGGGALMLNLPELFSDQLGITVKRAADYLEFETCRLRYAAGQRHEIEVLATAAGLAMEPTSYDHWR